ncbi:hypothetical protein ES703_32208 [subsurface metagenome]
MSTDLTSIHGREGFRDKVKTMEDFLLVVPLFKKCYLRLTIKKR